MEEEREISKAFSDLDWKADRVHDLLPLLTQRRPWYSVGETWWEETVLSMAKDPQGAAFF